MRKKLTLVDKIRHLGPGAIVASAIIGPGTVTTCGLAGYNYGLSLVWTVIAGCIMVAISQILTNRIAIGTHNGLAEVIRKKWYDNKSVFFLITALLLISVPGGNSAYEAGNLAGSVTGVSIVIGEHRVILCLIMAGFASILLLSGKLNVVKNFLTVLIFAMVVVFVICAILAKPDLGELLQGIIPRIPENAMFYCMGLVGTSISATNVFLHCGTVASANKNLTTDEEIEEALEYGTFDTIFSSVMIGLIMISIMIVGNTLAIRGEETSTVADLAKGLQPLAGQFAEHIFAFGIFAAGISSALTCPMGGAYVVAGLLDFPADLKEKKFKLVLMLILWLGCLAAIFGGTPTTIITTAQVANGAMLPISMIIIFLATRDRKLLGKYANNRVLNAACILMIVFSLAMSFKTFYGLLF